jgi:triphosphoribosyl-dephospho-CoA synthase CitG
MLSQKNFLSCSASEIAQLARNAAILEVSVSPKPGLVCPETSGAHKDMDYHTFINSALSLQDYFTHCVEIGYKPLSSLEKFALLRQAGIAAEDKMFAITKGVNTHKGLIFSLGIICCATGTLQTQTPQDPVAEICHEAAKMVKGIVANELAHGTRNPKTAGERIYLTHGITGVRGEAEAGFPHVIAAYACLQEAIDTYSWNDACCQALLYLIIHTQDTNVINRQGLTGLHTLQAGAKALPLKNFQKNYRAYCIQSTRQNLSPGGCADLLALAIFFYLLNRTEEDHVRNQSFNPNW